MADFNLFATWNPSAYLREYYSVLQQDERHTLRFFVDGMVHADPGPVLCFGSGPTLHHVMLTVPRMSEVVLADYLPVNLAEISKWRNQDPGAHDWTIFVRYILECESENPATEDRIAERIRLLRERITELAHGDASLDDPLGPRFRGYFSAVISPYCAEAATSDKATWARYCQNIATLVRPGGLFLTSAVRRCHQYKVGHQFFPTSYIDEDDMKMAMLASFRADSIRVEVREVPSHRDQGFSGILLATGTKGDRR